MRIRALLWLICALASAMDAQGFDYRKAAQTAARDLEVQQALPNDSGAADPAKSGATLTWNSGKGLDSAASGAGAIWEQLKWLVIAGLAVMAAVAIGSQIKERRGSTRVTPFMPVAATENAPERVALSPERWLAEAEAHAAAGRFRDAMHCVALAAVAQVTRRFRSGAPDSATSWELLRSAELQDVERTALRDLLTRTDRAWFGEHASGADEYEAARSSLQSFLAHGTA